MEDNARDAYTSFLGTGWSFPPEFPREACRVRMSHDEEDIRESLTILLGTSERERFLNPKYGLNLTEMLFEPLSTTMKTYLEDRVRTAILIYEPRVDVISLTIDTSAQYEGRVAVVLEYAVRATNSRYNLVFPFYKSDSNEMRASFGLPSETDK